MESVFDCIVNRRSVRSYTSQPVDKATIEKLLTAASYAPSAANMQPWRFVVIQDDKELKDKVASLSVYAQWVKTAPCLIFVYLDKNTLSDRVFNCELKHKQVIGSAIQNILLAARELQLGTCWIGEILKHEKELNVLLELPDNLELMAMLTVGYTQNLGGAGKREPLDKLVAKWL